MRSLKLFVLVAVASIVGGCMWTPDDPNEGSEGDFGGIQVTVRSAALGTGPAVEDVENIQVRLLPVGGTPDQIIELNLLQDGNGTSWSMVRDLLFVADYEVTAFGRDAVGEEIYRSHTQTVSIEKDVVVSVLIIMNQVTVPERHHLPQFNGLQLSQAAVQQGGTVTILVYGGGGIGSLVLSGRGPADATEFGTFSAPETFAGQTATLTWTAPHVAGQMRLVLVITDEEDNKAEVGVSVMVGEDWGTANLSVAFNLAPDMWLTGTTVVSPEAGTIYLWVTASDPDPTTAPSAMTYVWTTDCGGDFVTDPLLEGGAPASGSFPPGLAGEEVELYFKYEIVTNRNDCSLEIRVTDPDGANFARSVQVGPRMP